jgi:hypothetical protein
VGALPRNTEFLRNMSYRAAIKQNPFDQQNPAANGQTSINVRQENLLASGRLRHLH